jgi:CRP-like cAMP-binding protein
MDKAAMLERLRALPILHDVGTGVLEKLVHIAHEEHYQSGQALFEEGDEGDSLFFILDGAVVIQKRLEGDAYKDLAVSEAGDIIGEMALFDHKPRSATVRARCPLRALRIYRRDFEAFLEDDSASASAILGGLLTLQNGRLRDAAQQNVTMFELVNIIASVHDRRELARQIVERLSSSLRHVDGAAFCHWNPYLDECEVLYGKGLPHDDEAVLAISRSGPMAKVLLDAGEPFPLTDLGDEHPLRRVFRLSADDHVLVAPLKHGRDLLGYLILVGRGAGFTSFHRLMVAAVAAPVASTLVNLRYAEDEQARGRLEAARARGSR